MHRTSIAEEKCHWNAARTWFRCESGQSALRSCALDITVLGRYHRVYSELPPFAVQTTRHMLSLWLENKAIVMQVPTSRLACWIVLLSPRRMSKALTVDTAHKADATSCRNGAILVFKVRTGSRTADHDEIASWHSSDGIVQVGPIGDCNRKVLVV